MSSSGVALATLLAHVGQLDEKGLQLVADTCLNAIRMKNNLVARSPLLASTDPLELNLERRDICGHVGHGCVYHATSSNDPANVFQDHLIMMNPAWKELEGRQVLEEVRNVLSKERVAPGSRTVLWDHKLSLFTRDYVNYCFLRVTSHEAATRIQQRLATVCPDWHVNFKRHRERRKKEQEEEEEE